MTREEAIQELTEWREQMKNHGVPYWSAKLNALNMAIEALSADTVPIEKYHELQHQFVMLGATFADLTAVVRCKDCKWQKFIDWGMGDCLHPKGSRHIAYDNHYCSYGERREP